MKRLLILIAVFLLSAVAIFSFADPFNMFSSKVGDIIGKADYSDIDAYINDFPINSYKYEDYQLISTDDLKNYGFEVIYNDSENILNIYPDYSVEASDITPDIKSTIYKKNSKAYDILYSDTKVFLNGNEIPGFSAEGIMMIDISNLTLLGSVEYLEYAKCIKAWIDGFPKKEDLKNENIAKESEPAPQKEDVPAEESKESEVPEKDDENTTDETSSSEEDAQSSEKNAKPEDAESDKTKNEESKPEEPKAEAPKAEPSKTDVQTIEPPAPSSSGGAKRVIVLDPGHGKSSRLMSTDEKIAAGYCQHNGQWGEWRHWKNGTSGADCQGSGCNSYGSCWYPMVNGDRDTEPALNLRVALSAKYYLENELGYIVRMTRTSANENPSFSKRVSYCFPGGNFSSAPDAACYVCIHSNAGGGRGSAYIEAKGNYTQKWISPQFASQSNSLGKYINTRIVNGTSLNTYSSGRIGNQGHMILFNKCPVPAGYMEIGFFDSASDLAILNSEYDNIGKSIAYGIHDYLNS